ncbi:phosphoethanolamine--lipid A transferase [Shewanella submarina]|uniref:Phosphoethanolamine transferase n=1 Tax=Shewanella submarina TaxID=2016376 RepID=A0ABV7GI22_9GAMM|nr:phosphoethanolamine--lipid A transferase [Shewanella submarina]MCL1038060.1 phosphoethanolamine--lipid A transferase [Shewanella submarina]
MRFSIWPTSINRFTFLLALFYVCIFNIPFFSVVERGLAAQSAVNWWFVGSIPLFLLCALSILFSLFSVRYLVKPFFILLTLVSSLVFFGQWQYGIIFDAGMMQNIFQTNPAEAQTYLNMSSVLSFLLTGVLPSIWIYKAPLQYPKASTMLKQKGLFILFNAVIIGLIAALFLQNYVTFGRNNDNFKRSIVPTYFVGSLVKYVNITYLQKPLPYHELGLDAHETVKHHKPKLLVLVVGETARAKNFQNYGYDRPTNQYTAKDNMLVFNDVSSCGTATAVSLPCMFSRMNRKEYDARHAHAEDTLMDVLHHADIKLSWIDNDSGCKGVCDRIPHELIALDADPEFCNGESCQDQVLVDRLKTTLAKMNAHPEDTLIVLHMMGSHGPTYYQRYPKDKALFMPDCKRSDIQNCSHQELVNSYDNTLVYTDYILSEVIGVLKQESNQYETGMLYLSDHGESLGEDGMYLHGAPYAIAPDEQTHIPMFAWFSNSFLNDSKLSRSCIVAKAKAGGFSHDNLFDTVLGLMDVDTQIYRENQDIMASCKE